MLKVNANKEFIKSVEAVKIPKLSEGIEIHNDSELPSEAPLEFGLPPITQKPEAVPNLNFRKINNLKEDSLTMELLAKLDKNHSSPDGNYPDENDLTGSEGECDCEECLKEREMEQNKESSTQRRDDSEYIHKDLSPEEKEKRNRRIERLLKEGNSDNYRLLRDINKLQDIAESFSLKNKNK